MKYIQKLQFFDRTISIVASEQFVEEIRLSRIEDIENINLITTHVANWLKEYEDGKFKTFDFKLIKDLKTSESKVDQVYARLIGITLGKVITYKELAKLAHIDNAYRFVGTCMTKNNLPIIIPCHRVLKSDLTLGEYSFDGPNFKAQLLEHEQKYSVKKI